MKGVRELIGPSKKEFDFWFILTGMTNYQPTYTVMDNRTSQVVLTNKTEYELDIMTEIGSDFDKFKERPEYLVTKKSFECDSMDSKNQYIMKLIGCYLMFGYDEGQTIYELENCISWLLRTDFFTCPASTKYHDSCVGGLLKHTLLVVDKTLELLNIPSFWAVKPHEAIMVALMHDWCKIGLYETYQKNVKDSNGNWVTEDAYRVKSNPLTSFGHGVSSMLLAQRFFRITDEMLLAIRWHMGWTRVCEMEMVELTYAENHYPLVKLVEFADKLSVVD